MSFLVISCENLVNSLNWLRKFAKKRRQELKRGDARCLDFK